MKFLMHGNLKVMKDMQTENILINNNFMTVNESIAVFGKNNESIHYVDCRLVIWNGDFFYLGGE